jgi:glycerol-3-phosphate O-acyltransferase/dihydroxyacetone phosphate acyltransferase
VAAWRVLVGIWTPKRWDLSLTALSQYTTPPQPPASSWIDRPRIPNDTSDTDGKIESKCQDEIVVESRPPRRPPSHRLVRHVLRSRVEAMNALACFFDQLVRAGLGKKVKASPHLAERFGVKFKDLSAVTDEQEGWRYAVEVIAFLQKRGAKIPTLRQGPLEDEWALSSDGEGEDDAG